MKKFLALTGILSLLFVSLQAFADDYEVEVIDGQEKYVQMETQKHGFFTGLGPMIGFESNVLKSTAGGMTSQLGYMFNNHFTLLLQMDMFYTRDAGVNYLLFPLVPVAKWNFFDDFFIYAGGGYTYLWASSGPKFGRTASTGSKGYHGWSILGGAGYDLWWSDTFVISPQVGMDYTRIADSNVIIPMARVNFNWVF